MKNNRKWIVLFLLPGILLFAFIFLATLVILFGSSFTDWTIGKELSFVGLKNYINIFTEDAGFITAIKNTFIWILLQSTIHVVIGVTVALMLSRKRWYSNAVRTIFFIPNVISSAALGMLFLCTMNPQYGLLNQLISKITGEPCTTNWFLGSNSAFWTVTMTWLPYAGLVTILVMAEMSSISEDVYEAAKIDGATPLQTDFHIVLPLMRNIIGTCVVLAATSMLQKLDIIMMTTSGGPGNKTMNLPMYVYETVFTYKKFGKANAEGIVLIAVGIVCLKVIRKAFKMDEED
ncbi:MAG: sugar ABC transporter permease [Acetatifactor sp.]|nr:sugar ABC transporter permease [Acetatifactor sp.]